MARPSDPSRRKRSDRAVRLPQRVRLVMSEHNRYRNIHSFTQSKSLSSGKVCNVQTTRNDKTIKNQNSYPYQNQTVYYLRIHRGPLQWRLASLYRLLGVTWLEVSTFSRLTPELGKSVGATSSPSSSVHWLTMSLVLI